MIETIKARLTPDMTVLIKLDPDFEDSPVVILNEDDFAEICHSSLTDLQRETILTAIQVWLLENGYNPKEG